MSETDDQPWKRIHEITESFRSGVGDPSNPEFQADSETVRPAEDHIRMANHRNPNGYEIIAELGRGGMGVVYKAKQLKLNRMTALKMILSGHYAGENEVVRFRREAEAIARILHPNIVQIFEVGEHSGLPFFSMEYCPGGSLARKLKGAPLPPTEAAETVEIIARAIHVAHERGIVHRDLKPANVLLGEEGRIKISDFGLAKSIGELGQTASGVVVGTPSYMAPEQAGGRHNEIGPATDVYSLGAILYECLTGRPPFKAATPAETIMQVLTDAPVPPSLLQSRVPKALERICLKCLEKRPARRFANAEVLAGELSSFLSSRDAEHQIMEVRSQDLDTATQYGLASTLISCTVVITSAVLMAFNVLLAAHPSIVPGNLRWLAMLGCLAGSFSFLALAASSVAFGIQGWRIARAAGQFSPLAVGGTLIGAVGLLAALIFGIDLFLIVNW